MYVFGSTSAGRLATCHPLLQQVMSEAIVHSPVDFTIVCGHRGREAQEKAVAEGKSRAGFGQSPHNFKPAVAVDVAPYVAGRGLVWDDDALWQALSGHIMETAKRLHVPLRWGGDWNRDGDLTTSDSWDKPHFELDPWRRYREVV